ncbi:unnamed protein product [Linum tenue]|uniref:Uncharacterized protein n=1 Tax=Linum tenue TaxID=586396 RepID=A0AAV0IIP1_9ROSI|nr:unnamed protein product [Linum tenue]
MGDVVNSDEGEREAVESNECHHHLLLSKLKTAEMEIEELKQMRKEDGKANEKVVGIFASQEQTWFIERKKLRLHIGTLMNQLEFFQKEKEQVISEFHYKIGGMEGLLQAKDKALEEEENKRKELDEKLTRAANSVEELRESMRREAQEHSADLWKHKTAFLELVSNQRQVEAEMGRLVKQLEVKRQELNSAVEQKEESAAEVVKLRTDLEQKEKILSAVLRRTKADVSEKQMLVKEVKVSKARRKQAELETERWRAAAHASETRHEKKQHSLRSMFANARQDDDGLTKGRSSHSSDNYVFEYENPEFLNDSDMASFPYDYSPDGRAAELADVRRLEGWIRTEAERYAAAIEKRHHVEIDAFVEQLRLKDEKLEAFRRKFLSTQIESNRLQSHLESLNQELSRVRHENMKLEASLLQIKEEVSCLQQQAIMSQSAQQPLVTISHQPKNEIIMAVESPEKEFEEEKHVTEQGPTINEGSPSSMAEIESVKSIATSSKALVINTNGSSNNPWRMDLQALGVSYKIKRLKQQLLMLERLTGKQESGEEDSGDQENGVKGFLMLISLLNRQINRYQTLQAKTDELCKRMHDNVETCSSGKREERSKGEMKRLEHYLEETFQVQRYMVATGQKLMDVQTKIGSGFVEVPEELNKSGRHINIKMFADNVKALLQEVQRGLEVRIARIIGDLEGTLACQGMIRLRR